MPALNALFDLRDPVRRPENQSSDPVRELSASDCRSIGSRNPDSRTTGAEDPFSAEYLCLVLLQVLLFRRLPFFSTLLTQTVSSVVLWRSCVIRGGKFESNADTLPFSIKNYPLDRTGIFSCRVHELSEFVQLSCPVDAGSVPDGDCREV